MQEERRRHRRLRLRVGVAPVSGFGSAAAGSSFRARNVSAGGACFEVPGVYAPAEGDEVAFELTVPPGEGYSARPSRLRGAGRVIRREPGAGSAVGVAVQFTRPLALNLATRPAGVVLDDGKEKR